MGASDCPQVQCVEQYVAQQADELSLEPTEIVNVIRKTNEGKKLQRLLLKKKKRSFFPNMLIEICVIIVSSEEIFVSDCLCVHPSLFLNPTCSSFSF